MKIVILTHNVNPFSHKRLYEAGKARGHDMRYIRLSYCYSNISSENPEIYYRDKENFNDVDAIIPRIGIKHSLFGTLVLRQLERLNIYSLNDSMSIALCADKLGTFQQLAQNGIPLPITGTADSTEESEKLIELVGGPPLIVRLLDSAQGKKTIFADTKQSAVSIIHAFKQLNANIFVQEYIEEARGNDIRCVVVGNQVVVAIQRCIEQSFSKQKTLFTFQQPIKLSAAEKKLALQAARVLRLNLATVDLIQSRRGPLVLDIDASPNIEILEKCVQIDIATPILKFIEKNATKRD